MALTGDFEFAVRHTKGEEKVCVLDCNHWLLKMVIGMLHAKYFIYFIIYLEALSHSPELSGLMKELMVFKKCKMKRPPVNHL